MFTTVLQRALFTAPLIDSKMRLLNPRPLCLRNWSRARSRRRMRIRADFIERVTGMLRPYNPKGEGYVGWNASPNRPAVVTWELLGVLSNLLPNINFKINEILV